MKRLKILVSLTGLFLVFCFVNVSAMERSVTAESQKSNECLKSVEFDEKNKIIIFNLAADSKYYGNDALRLELEERYQEFNFQAQSREILNESIAQNIDVSDEVLLELFNNENIEKLGYSVEYNKFGEEEKKFIIKFRDISFLGEGGFENLRNNPKRRMFIDKIRGFIDFVINKILNRPKLVNTNNEYELDLVFSKDALTAYEHINNEFQKKFLNDEEFKKAMENVNFDGKQKDFDMFYNIAYKNILKKYSKGSGFFSLLDPENIEYMHIKENLKVIIKFKNSLDLTNKKILLNFKEMQHFEFAACLIKKIFLFYIETAEKKTINFEKKYSLNKRYK